MMRCASWGCCIALTWASVAAAATPADTVQEYRIEAGPLCAALTEFSIASQVKVYFPDGLCGPRYCAHAVSGRMTPNAALDRLLGTSGVTRKWIGDNAITLHEPPATDSDECSGSAK